MRPGPISSLALSAFVIAACSSSGTAARSGSTPALTPHAPAEQSTSEQATGPDACGLLTDAQIEAATATAVTDHHEVPPADLDSICVWTLTANDPADIANPSVTVKTVTNDQLTSDLDTYGDATRQYGVVTGIGEKAAQGRNEEVGPEELVFLFRGVVYTVSAQVTGDQDKDEAIDENLARVVGA